MPIWEYKHLTSGQHGFATPAHLETHLNQLGKDEWEIIHYQTDPANPLAFTALARRPTTRDWTLEDTIAKAAQAEAEKLRAEFAAKFQSAQQAAATEDKPATLLTETETPQTDDIRKLRDTERDLDPEAHDEEETDWDNWEAEDDDLPTFFDAIKPHLRKNLRGPGQSVAIDYLAKRWQIPSTDLLAALKECNFAIPETEDTPPRHLEYEGDLYWLNLNNRQQLFLNTREKPRPVFRTLAAQPLSSDDPAARQLADEAAAENAAKEKREQERQQRQQQAAAKKVAANVSSQATTPDNKGTHKNAAAPHPLLDALRAQMRRNRRGPGISGNISQLARALKTSDPDLLSQLAELGIPAPEKHNQKLPETEISGHRYWLNRDGNGGYWLNSRYAQQPTPKPVAANVSSQASEQPAVQQPTTDSDVAANVSSQAAPAAEETQPANTDSKTAPASEKPKRDKAPSKTAKPAAKKSAAPKPKKTPVKKAAAAKTQKSPAKTASKKPTPKKKK